MRLKVYIFVYSFLYGLKGLTVQSSSVQYHKSTNSLSENSNPLTSIPVLTRRPATDPSDSTNELTINNVKSDATSGKDLVYTHRGAESISTAHSLDSNNDVSATEALAAEIHENGRDIETSTMDQIDDYTHSIKTEILTTEALRNGHFSETSKIDETEDSSQGKTSETDQVTYHTPSSAKVGSFEDYSSQMPVTGIDPNISNIQKTTMLSGISDSNTNLYTSKNRLTEEEGMTIKTDSTERRDEMTADYTMISKNPSTDAAVASSPVTNVQVTYEIDASASLSSKQNTDPTDGIKRSADIGLTTTLSLQGDTDKISAGFTSTQDIEKDTFTTQSNDATHKPENDDLTIIFTTEMDDLKSQKHNSVTTLGVTTGAASDNTMKDNIFESVESTDASGDSDISVSLQTENKEFPNSTKSNSKDLIATNFTKDLVDSSSKYTTDSTSKHELFTFDKTNQFSSTHLALSVRPADFATNSHSSTMTTDAIKPSDQTSTESHDETSSTTYKTEQKTKTEVQQTSFSTSTTSETETANNLSIINNHENTISASYPIGPQSETTDNAKFSEYTTGKKETEYIKNAVQETTFIQTDTTSSDKTSYPSSFTPIYKVISKRSSTVSVPASSMEDQTLTGSVEGESFSPELKYKSTKEYQDILLRDLLTTSSNLHPDYGDTEEYTKVSSSGTFAQNTKQAVTLRFRESTVFSSTVSQNNNELNSDVSKSLLTTATSLHTPMSEDKIAGKMTRDTPTIMSTVVNNLKGQTTTDSNTVTSNVTENSTPEVTMANRTAIQEGITTSNSNTSNGIEPIVSQYRGTSTSVMSTILPNERHTSDKLETDASTHIATAKTDTQNSEKTEIVKTSTRSGLQLQSDEEILVHSFTTDSLAHIRNNEANADISLQSNSMTTTDYDIHTTNRLTLNTNQNNGRLGGAISLSSITTHVDSEPSTNTQSYISPLMRSDHSSMGGTSHFINKRSYQQSTNQNQFTSHDQKEYTISSLSFLTNTKTTSSDFQEVNNIGTMVVTTTHSESTAKSLTNTHAKSTEKQSDITTMSVETATTISKDKTTKTGTEVFSTRNSGGKETDASNITESTLPTHNLQSIYKTAPVSDTNGMNTTLQTNGASTYSLAAMLNTSEITSQSSKNMIYTNTDRHFITAGEELRQTTSTDSYLGTKDSYTTETIRTTASTDRTAEAANPTNITSKKQEEIGPENVLQEKSTIGNGVRTTDRTDRVETTENEDSLISLVHEKIGTTDIPINTVTVFSNLPKTESSEVLSTVSNGGSLVLTNSLSQETTGFTESLKHIDSTWTAATTKAKTETSTPDTVLSTHADTEKEGMEVPASVFDALTILNGEYTTTLNVRNNITGSTTKKPETKAETHLPTATDKETETKSNQLTTSDNTVLYSEIISTDTIGNTSTETSTAVNATKETRASNTEWSSNYLRTTLINEQTSYATISDKLSGTTNVADKFVSSGEDEINTVLITNAPTSETESDLSSPITDQSQVSDDFKESTSKAVNKETTTDKSIYEPWQSSQTAIQDETVSFSYVQRETTNTSPDLKDHTTHRYQTNSIKYDQQDMLGLSSSLPDSASLPTSQSDSPNDSSIELNEIKTTAAHSQSSSTSISSEELLTSISSKPEKSQAADIVSTKVILHSTTIPSPVSDSFVSVPTVSAETNELSAVSTTTRTAVTTSGEGKTISSFNDNISITTNDNSRGISLFQDDTYTLSTEFEETTTLPIGTHTDSDDTSVTSARSTTLDGSDTLSSVPFESSPVSEEDDHATKVKRSAPVTDVKNSPSSETTLTEGTSSGVSDIISTVSTAFKSESERHWVTQMSSSVKEEESFYSLDYKSSTIDNHVFTGSSEDTRSFSTNGEAFDSSSLAPDTFTVTKGFKYSVSTASSDILSINAVYESTSSQSKDTAGTIFTFQDGKDSSAVIFHSTDSSQITSVTALTDSNLDSSSKSVQEEISSSSITAYTSQSSPSFQGYEDNIHKTDQTRTDDILSVTPRALDYTSDTSVGQASTNILSTEKDGTDKISSNHDLTDISTTFGYETETTVGTVVIPTNGENIKSTGSHDNGILTTDQYSVSTKFTNEASKSSKSTILNEKEGTFSNPDVTYHTEQYISDIQYNTSTLSDTFDITKTTASVPDNTVLDSIYTGYTTPSTNKQNTTFGSNTQDPAVTPPTFPNEANTRQTATDNVQIVTYQGTTNTEVVSEDRNTIIFTTTDGAGAISTVSESTRTTSSDERGTGTFSSGPDTVSTSKVGTKSTTQNYLSDTNSFSSDPNENENKFDTITKIPFSTETISKTEHGSTVIPEELRTRQSYLASKQSVTTFNPGDTSSTYITEATTDNVSGDESTNTVTEGHGINPTVSDNISTDHTAEAFPDTVSDNESTNIVTEEGHDTYPTVSDNIHTAQIYTQPTSNTVTVETESKQTFTDYTILSTIFPSTTSREVKDSKSTFSTDYIETSPKYVLTKDTVFTVQDDTKSTTRDEISVISTVHGMNKSATTIHSSSTEKTPYHLSTTSMNLDENADISTSSDVNRKFKTVPDGPSTTRKSSSTLETRSLEVTKETIGQDETDIFTSKVSDITSALYTNQEMDSLTTTDSIKESPSTSTTIVDYTTFETSDVNDILSSTDQFDTYHKNSKTNDMSTSVAESGYKLSQTTVRTDKSNTISTMQTKVSLMTVKKSTELSSSDIYTTASTSSPLPLDSTMSLSTTNTTSDPTVISDSTTSSFSNSNTNTTPFIREIKNTIYTDMKDIKTATTVTYGNNNNTDYTNAVNNSYITTSKGDSNIFSTFPDKVTNGADSIDGTSFRSNLDSKGTLSSLSHTMLTKTTTPGETNTNRLVIHDDQNTISTMQDNKDTFSSVSDGNAIISSISKSFTTTGEYITETTASDGNKEVRNSERTTNTKAIPDRHGI
ncbi:serine-rich adhesin for platelets-like [Mercenaria mercenaria]|uniref:serine-rich adhesin for platelets-like n=1 Tax=Mercenaria mercenaria TaxID=6596 RepID=UPI00234F4409|nr:serine-rich adhesin for platelets-like [Mercenaria mercenaria]